MEKVSFHHYSLLFDSEEVSERMKDVRFLLIAGDSRRVDGQARYLAENLFNGGPDGFMNEKLQVDLLTKEHSRFALYKIGPVLLSNHGMGSASMSIALHELFIMCKLANIMDRLTVIRFGTCGGIGVPAGTVCITNCALDPLFQDFVELKICMKLVRRPCTMDLDTARLLERLARENPPNAKEYGRFEVRSGGTIASNDFYEEQGRTIGAICDHTVEDKKKFLELSRDRGVINMEMEGNHLAAMCSKLGVSFGIICVALTDRLVDDRVCLTHEEMAMFERRLFHLNMLLVRHKLVAPN